MSAEPQFNPDAVEAVDCRGMPGDVDAGDSALLEVDVRNPNTSDAVLDIVVADGGTEFGRETSVTVRAGGTQTFEVPLTFEQSGTFSPEAVTDRVRRPFARLRRLD